MADRSTSLRLTSCPMDCPDTCALEVVVTDGRIDSIRGREDHPDTAGFICSKIAGFAQRVQHADRLLEPLRRRGRKGAGEFEAISWEAAIAEIAERFRDITRRWGGEAIVPFHYGGSNGKLTDGLLDALFFDRLGASRLDLTICAVPTTAVATAMYGKMPTVPFADFPEARCIVIWGANPKVSNIHLVPYLREAKRRGAFIAAVDPRRNFSSAEIDLHLAVRPGTDLPVALSMIRLWNEQGRLDGDFIADNTVGSQRLLAAASQWSVPRAASEAGVDGRSIERLAELYASSQPALLRCGWGLERNRNGGQAVAAILAMPALLGKFGVRGGGYAMSNGGAYDFRRQRVVGRLDGDSRRVLNMSQLSRWLLEAEDPPVQGLFVYNANPVATAPNQRAVIEGFERETLFTVVFDQVMTDTARFADLVLPATTFLEGWDLRAGYGSYVVGGIRPVVAARGQARSNVEVFAALGRAMGFPDQPFRWQEEELFRRSAEALSFDGESVDCDYLMQGGLEMREANQKHRIQFDTIHPRTGDAKAHLTPSVLGPTPYAYTRDDGEYPLALISPATARLVNSTLGEYNLPELTVEIHPDDAETRAIATGDLVRVFNQLGVVDCRAVVSERIRLGVVMMPKGAWRRSSRNGATATALCPDHLNVVGGAACFNDARVEIEKL